MQCKKILIAFDGSENSYRAANYVAEIAAGMEGITVTLLHVEILPDRDMYPGEESWKRVCREREESSRNHLSEGATILVAKGLPESAVSTEYIPDCRSPFHDQVQCSVGAGVASDILAMQERLGFGTVVVGRKGVSKQEEFLFGSVSSKIMREAQGCTVWVVN